VRSEIWP